jgi:hypothetical protein
MVQALAVETDLDRVGDSVKSVWLSGESDEGLPHGESSWVVRWSRVRMHALTREGDSALD